MSPAVVGSLITAGATLLATFLRIHFMQEKILDRLDNVDEDLGDIRKALGLKADKHEVAHLRKRIVAAESPE